MNDSTELKRLARRLIDNTRICLAYRAMRDGCIDLQNEYGDTSKSFLVYESACTLCEIYQSLYDRSVRNMQLASIDFAYEYKHIFKREISTLNCFHFAKQIRLD